MGTTRQRQRLLINGLMTVFLLSLLGGCGMQSPPNTNTTTPETTQPTTPEPTPEQILAQDILRLKKELAEIENLVFGASPLYDKAKEQLTQFKQSFQAFSEKYQNEPRLKPQIKKINDLLEQADADLNNSELQKSRLDFDAKSQPIFDELTSGLDSFNQLPKTPPSVTKPNQNQTAEKNPNLPGGDTTNTAETQSHSPGDRKSDGTQVFFTLGFLVIIFVILLLVKPKIKDLQKILFNQPIGDSPKSDGSTHQIKTLATTLPLENNIQLDGKINSLSNEFNQLSALISGVQEYSIKQGEFNSLQQTLNSIQKEIKSIARSIPESVGRTSSDDNTLVQQYVTQIGTLNQETQNLRDRINLLEKEKGSQSDEIRYLKAQLDQFLNSHANAVSSVQDNQLEKNFNDLSKEYETLKNKYNNLEQKIQNNNAANQGELEESKQQLTVVQQKLDQVTSDLTKVTAERDKLQEKLDELEEKQKKLNRRQKINDNSYQTSSNEVFSDLSIGGQSNSSSSSPLPADIKRLVDDYNQNPKSLQNRKAATVDFTGSDYDAHRSGNQSAILENTTKTGAYWVVTSSSDTWLFPPDTKLKQKSDYYTLSALYECHQYQENLTKFTLIKPAKVSKFGSNQWQLIEKGQLEFTS